MNPDRGYRKAKLPDDARRVFEGKIFDVYQWEQKLYDGSTATFEKITRPDTAGIIPVLPDGRILLIEDSQPQRETILTIPTGKVDEGETPADTVRRELLEETGYAVDSIEQIFERQVTGKLDWNVYTFVGRGAKKVQEAEPEPGEKIVPRIVTFEEFLELASEPKQKVLRDDTDNIVLRAKADPAQMEVLKKLLFG